MRPAGFEPASVSLLRDLESRAFNHFATDAKCAGQDSNLQCFLVLRPKRSAFNLFAYPHTCGGEELNLRCFLVPDPRSGAFDLFATAANYTGGSKSTGGSSTHSAVSTMRFMSSTSRCFSFFSLTPFFLLDIIHTAPLRGKRPAGIEPASSGSAIRRLAIQPQTHTSQWWGSNPPSPVYETGATPSLLHRQSRRRGLNPLSPAYQADAVPLPPRRHSYVVLLPEQLRSRFLVVKRFAPLRESLLASFNYFLLESF